MNTGALTANLTGLFGELIHGAPGVGPAYVLNRGDPGLLAVLDRISARDASRASGGGAPVAAHVEHLRYGFSLVNAWAAGGDPFATADWTASWRRTTVSEAEWPELRQSLRREAEHWLGVLGTPRELDVAGVNELLGSIVHLAYHVGAIRQVDRQLRGPAATELPGGTGTRS